MKVHKAPTPGRLIVLPRSRRWLTAIGQSLRPAVPLFALDLDDVLREAHRHPGSIAAVELPTEPDLHPMLAWIARHNNHFSRLRWVALATTGLAAWQPVFRMTGFVDTLWTTIDARRLPGLIEARSPDPAWPIRTVETQLVDDLPWPGRRRSPSFPQSQLQPQAHNEH